MTRPASVRSLQAQAAVHTSWARTSDRAARTAPARAAQLDRFAKQVDPDGVLPPAERAQRAESARRAYMLSLSAKSAQTRARKAAAKARETVRSQRRAS